MYGLQYLSKLLKMNEENYVTCYYSYVWSKNNSYLRSFVLLCFLLVRQQRN
jgi:hypothetical protein